MASSQTSILHNFDQPLYSPDLQLITTALTMKTEKLNINRQKLQNLRDQFGALDVMKDVDANYLENRLQQVTELTNQYAGGDLSDDGLARSLQANLSQVIDDNVKNAVLSTKLRRAENAEWDKMKVDKQELYSDLNRAYASQSAQAWAANEQVGAVYRGGGGFIAFDDIDKRMLKELPEAIKTLKDTWVETVPGSGMFYDIVTKEAVPRDEVENAMNMVIGQKGAEQMRINAWGANQGKSTEQLKQEYDGYFAPKIQELDQEITKTQHALATDKKLTSDDKALMQQRIENMQANRDNMIGNSFDKVAAVDGEGAAYTTLYTQKYKNGILDTYSYAPRIIERKIDENHKATIEFQHKLEREQVEDSHWDQTHALQMTKDYRAQMKFEQEFNVGADGKVKPTGDITQGKAQEQDTPEIEQAIVRKQNEEKQAITGMKDIVNSILGKTLTTNQLLQLQGQIDLGKAINDVEIDGVKFQINTKKHFNSLLAFQDKVLNPSTGDVMLQNTITTAAEKTTWQLSQMTAAVYSGKGADFTPTELPNMQFMFQEDKAGKMTRVKTPEGSHMFARLLKMNGQDPSSLTKAQKLTLDTYVQYHMAADPTVSKAVQNEIMSNIRQNVWKGVPTSAVNGLPTNVTSLNTMYDQADPTFANRSQKGKGIKGGNTMNTILSTAGFEPVEQLVALREGKFGGSGDFYFSDLKSNDMEYTDEKGKEVSFRGLGAQLSDAFDLNTQQAEATIGQDYKLFKSNELIFEGNKDLEHLTGAPSKTPITLIAKYNSEGKLTGEVDWSYYTGTGEKRVLVTSEDHPEKGIDIDVLAKNGISFRNVNRTDYMAEKQGAPTIDLGNGYDPQAMFDIKRNYSYEENPFITDEAVPQMLTELKKYGQEKPIQDMLRSYTNGDYTFKIEPYAGTYHRSIYKGETLLRRYDTKESTYEKDEIKNMYDNALIDNNAIFYRYLEEKADELRTIGKSLIND